MNTDDNMRWFEVLAGRVEPTDQDTRQAYALRQVLLAELDRQDHATDPAAVERVMKRLRAKGAFEPPPRQKSGAWKRFAAWFVSATAGAAPGSGFAMGGRRAVLATVVATMVAVPVWMQLRPSELDEDGTKGLQSIQAEPQAQRPAMVVESSTPDAAAAKLASALGAHKIAVRIVHEGAAVVLTADVPVENLVETQADLLKLGVPLPPDGLLQVRFTPRR